MKILVVGSTSVIGRAIAGRARVLGDVKLAGRRDADHFIDLSRSDFPTVTEPFDVVVHAAADFGGTSDQDFVRAEQVNASGTLLVCSLARLVGARMILMISSVSAGYRPGDRHFGIYALSKRHAEEAAQLFCLERNIALAILRPTQVYDDAGACRTHQEFLYSMADRAQRGEDIFLHGSHDAIRNYIHLDDLAEICCRVIAQGCQGAHVCAHPENVRLSEAALAAFEAFGQGGNLRFLPQHDDLEDLPPMETLTLYDRIGFRPSINIQQGFERMRKFRDIHP